MKSAYGFRIWAALPRRVLSRFSGGLGWADRNAEGHALFSKPLSHATRFRAAELRLVINQQLAKEVIGAVKTFPVGVLEHIAQQKHHNVLALLELDQKMERVIAVSRQHGLFAHTTADNCAVTGKPFRG